MTLKLSNAESRLNFFALTLLPTFMLRKMIKYMEIAKKKQDLITDCTTEDCSTD